MNGFLLDERNKVLKCFSFSFDAFFCVSILFITSCLLFTVEIKFNIYHRLEMGGDFSEIYDLN